MIKLFKFTPSAAISYNTWFTTGAVPYECMNEKVNYKVGDLIVGPMVVRLRPH